MPALLSTAGLIPISEEVGWEEVYKKNIDESDGTLVVGKIQGTRDN